MRPTGAGDRSASDAFTARAASALGQPIATTVNLSQQ